MKILFLIFTLILSNSVSAAGMMDSKEVQEKIRAAETEAKNILSQELMQAVGIQEFVLKVNFKVDEGKLKKTLGISTDEWSTVKEMQLPGLFADGKESFSDAVFARITPQDILQSLRDIKVDIYYHQENYTDEFLSKAIKKIIVFNYPYLKETQMQVVTTKGDAPYRVDNKSAESVLAKVFDKPLDINVTESEFQTHFRIIMVIVAVLILVTGLIVYGGLKGGLGSLAETIKSKTFSAPTARSENTPIRNDVSNPVGKGSDNFDSYIQATEYLSTMVKNDSKLFNEILLLKLMAHDFLSLTILMDVLPKERREIFLKNIDNDKRELIKNFIVEHGLGMLKDESVLKIEAVNIIKLMKVSAMSPDELYHIVVSDVIKSLSTVELGDLMVNMTLNEKAFVCSILDNEKLAHLIQNDFMTGEEILLKNVISTRSEMIDLLLKTSSLRSVQKKLVLDEKLESVYAQMETSKAEVFADTVGISAQMRFEVLFMNNQDDAINYLESMDYQNLSMLYPLLTIDMQKKLISALPEILSERLKISRKVVTSEGLKLKSQFYIHLKSMTVSEATTELKLVA